MNNDVKSNISQTSNRQKPAISHHCTVSESERLHIQIRRVHFAYLDQVQLRAAWTLRQEIYQGQLYYDD